MVKQHVAKKALDQLQLICKRKQSLLISNDEDLRERIPPIVKSHVNGVWKWQLEADYAEKFNEQLPNNWLEIIDRIPTIEITSCLDKYVLRHCKPGEVKIYFIILSFCLVCVVCLFNSLVAMVLFFMVQAFQLEKLIELVVTVNIGEYYVNFS